MIDILIQLLIMIVIFAVIVYALNTFVPLDPPLKSLVMLIVGVIFLIWLLLALTGTGPGLHLWRGHP